MPLTTLPPEYNTHKVISLRKGKPHAKWVYSLNLLVFLVAVWLMSRFIPFLTMFEKVNESYIISVPRFILNLVMTTFILLC
ncbi:MAG: hypothetical protein IIY12_01785, partial [Clostridia bacterium]|nr:hypothetical protein [Clostridia bacterium]